MIGRLFFLPVFAFTILGACAGELIDDGAATRPLGFDFGNAIRQNEAVQAIGTRPAVSGEPAPSLDGRRAAAAMDRYQNGAVRVLDIVPTADSKTE
jgi:hypothetical protein